MNQQFAELSGLRPATISLMINNKYDRILLEHLLNLMQVLQITDFIDILEIIELKINKHRIQREHRTS